MDDELAKLVANMKEGDDNGGGGGSGPAGGLEVLRQLVATRAARRALFITMSLFTVQQFCGINAILSYTVEIFQVGLCCCALPLASRGQHGHHRGQPRPAHVW